MALASKRILPSKRTQVVPKGLSFNGVTDYLQLPSMTMDSIEIECLILSGQTNAFLVDARNGLNNGYWYVPFADSLGSGFIQMLVNGVNQTTIPKNTRVKIRLNSSFPFTDDVNIFSKYDTWGRMSGTIYKVTCYLNGAIVAQYDFENTKNIVGNTVIPNAQNLIPSFEDGRWSVHPNAKVLGKDVLHLDATAIGQQNFIPIYVVQGQKYLISCNFGGSVIADHRVRLWANNANGVLNTNIISVNPSLIPYTWTADRNLVYLSVENQNIGSFDFIKPQLYQLTGQEGTIYGAPQQLNKQEKRQMYAKR